MSKLEITKLKDALVSRPVGQLGTVGWYPKAWTMAYITNGETAAQAFLRANPNWNASDIESR